MVFIRILFLFCIFALQIIASAAYAKETITIMFFGDSIVAGYGLDKSEAFPEQFKNILLQDGHQVEVINAGVSGDTSSGGRSRLEWTLEKNKPDIVVLAIGGNDMLRGVSPALTRENTDAMLKTLTDKKIKTVLSAVRAPINLGLEYSGQFNNIYADLADKYDVPLYPFLLEKVYGKTALMQPDGIHPNANGAAVIAKDLAEFIEDEFLD